MNLHDSHSHNGDKRRKIVQTYYFKHGTRFKRYGITEQIYNEMLQEQNGLCAICGKEELIVQNGKERSSLHIDHDHESGKIRGLLCFACNTGIGKFNHDPDSLRKASEYVASFQQKILRDNS